MRDAHLVGRFEPLRDLPRDRKCLRQRDRSTRDPIGEGRSFDELHHNGADGRGPGAGVFQTVNMCDVGMVEGGQYLCFALESREPFRVSGDEVGQNLDRDVAIQPCVARPKHLAHPPGAKGRKDLIGPESNSGGKSHPVFGLM